MKFLENIDFLSDAIQVNVKGSSKYKTSFGGFFTIIAGIICSILSGYFLVQTFGRKQVSVTTSQEINENSFYDLTKFPMLFNVLDGYANPFSEADRIFEIVPRIWHRDEKLNWSFEELKLEKCDYNWYPDFEGEMKKDLKDNRLYCLNPNNPQNKNKMSNRGTFKSSFTIQHLGIHFFKCTNDTSKNKTNCLPPDVIEEKLSYTFLRYVVVDTTIDSTKSTPGTTFLTTSELLLSSKLFKIFNFNFREIVYTSDFGYVFESKDEITYYSLEPVNIEIGIGNRETEFSSIRTINSDTRIRYYRKFSKLQDVVAQVGGVLKLIIYISKIIVMYVSNKVFLNEFAVKLYDIRKLTHNDTSGIVALQNYFNSTPQNKKKMVKISNIKLSLIEYLIPLKCLRRHSTPSILNKVDFHVKKTFSFEKIFSTILDLNVMKAIILDKEEIVSIRNLTRPTVKQFLNVVEIEDFEAEDKNNLQEDSCVAKLRGSERGDRILKLIQERKIFMGFH